MRVLMRAVVWVAISGLFLWAVVLLAAFTGKGGDGERPW